MATIITTLPPAPSRNDPDTFADKGDAMMAALPIMVNEINTANSEIEANAIIAEAGRAAAEVAVSVVNYKGVYSPSTTYLLGQSVSYLGLIYVANKTNLGITPVDGADWFKIQKISTVAYDSRNSVRSIVASEGDKIVIEELGLFSFSVGSTELDDDESCFSNGSGRWILVGISPEFALSHDELQQSEILDLSSRATSLESRATSLESRATSLESKILYGSVTTTATTLATLTTLTATATVTGANVGDRVVVSPSVNAERLSYSATVTSTNTVSVRINNPSASSATLTNPTVYYIAVITQ